MKEEMIIKRNDCRVCHKEKLEKVFCFGPTPLANAFLRYGQIDKPEYFYPLDVYFCHNCTFLQLGHVVSPEILFGDYVYVSSTSPVFIKHFEDLADELIPRFGLSNKSLVIDIGSNDGILLKPFKNRGVRVLGIEPAEHIARKAMKDDIPTIPEFFSVKLASKIVKSEGKADLVTGTNVFAHIDDLDEVLKGVKILLDDDGVFITESPYLVDFIQKRYFDLVYHEHLSYWAIKPLIMLFDRFDMEIFDVQKVPVHGGSIRVFAKKKVGTHKKTKRVASFLKQEKRTRLHDIKTYIEFAKLVQENKVKLITILGKLKSQGKKIAGYGAPAKGNTLLNFFSIGSETIDFIVDDSPWKQGLFSPGKHIPVVSPKTLYEKRVDYLLILAWNFAESIIKNHNGFGGKFIIPVPKPRII